MKILISLITLLLSFGAVAQTTDSLYEAEMQQNICFDVPFKVVCYATHYCTGETFSALHSAISKVTTETDSMNKIVSLTLKEEYILPIMNVLGCVQVRVAEEYNGLLRQALLPQLSARPYLMAKVTQYYQERDRLKAEIEQNGKRILDKIRELYNLN